MQIELLKEHIIKIDGYSQSYAGFFHTNYPGISDTVMGMDGYGGVASNFDDNQLFTSSVKFNAIISLEFLGYLHLFFNQYQKLYINL